ncbi:glycosyltransferase 87 family protein [Kitasatospora sp. CM 4170]|uniref:glycosyltransferase 87 family protein n=1 Tax=Kitasatospora sp. CM 4170 TaxID=3075627 RepID=UPI0028A7EDCB|nr:glycosyltransferase 87 family protein [Kitasatospora sp. CM 4170]WNM44373.1 glycosyltransferase 87 family protein [Kitasatospora sp. CM 4170]
MRLHRVSRPERATGRPPGGRRLLWSGGWLVAAGWAAAFPLLSALGPHRSWGLIATAGYLGAAVAVLVLPPQWARSGAAAVALAGAVVVPLLVLVTAGQGQSEVTVVERSGDLLLRHGTPYLAEPHTVTEVTPYLPGMALFGLPHALVGADSPPARLLGDPRVWCAAVFLGCLPAAAAGSRRRGARTGRRGAPTWRRTALVPVVALVASPLVALPLCVSGIDLPMTGLCCLALALAGRDRPFGSGLALALACALKWTAWPAVAVTAALLAATAGRRSAVRAAATAVVGAAALVLPSALRSPGALLRQVFAFPTGRGELPTPASSPLPGRLLADLGPAGWYAAAALLLLAGLAVAVSLVLHPPRDGVSAADRLALGLALAFLLAPAGRFGYLALPVLLWLLARLWSAVDPTAVDPTVGGAVGPGRAVGPFAVPAGAGAASASAAAGRRSAGVAPAARVVPRPTTAPAPSSVLAPSSSVLAHRTEVVPAP